MGTQQLGDFVDAQDRGLQRAEARIVLEPAVQQLSERDRRVLHLRFYEERTQQDIADTLGLTQAQVSRILARLLSNLRSELRDRTSAA